MAENAQNAHTIAELIADVLDPRDDIAGAIADGREVHVTTQAGKLFTIEVKAGRLE